MPVVVDGELKSVGRWCQGKVLRAYKGRKQPTLRVLWDPMPDVGGYKDVRRGTNNEATRKGRRWRRIRSNMISRCGVG